MTHKICEPLRRLTSVKQEWSLNKTWWVIQQPQSYYQEWCMYEVLQWKELLHLETDASGVGLETGLLQVGKGMNCPRDETWDNTTLCPIAYTSKSLSSAKPGTATSRSAQHITWFRKNFYHYCFIHNVIVITDHKPLVVIFKKMYHHSDNSFNTS